VPAEEDIDGSPADVTVSEDCISEAVLSVVRAIIVAEAVSSLVPAAPSIVVVDDERVADSAAADVTVDI